MEFPAFIIKRHMDKRVKAYVKTVMETVRCLRTHQQAGDDGSPVQVYSAEDHSGVSFPKAAVDFLRQPYRK